MTAVSKNVYIDKLDEIVDKYNNKYQRTIKMKPADVKSGTNMSMVFRGMRKILNSKLVIM